jgi:hypothetical protein
MNYYHLDNPDVYYECFDEEVEHYVKLMSKLDDAIIMANLSLPGKSKDLFDMVDAMIYSVERRYKKKNLIVEEDDGCFTYLKKEELIDSMKTVLQEEVARHFAQGSDNV